MFRHVSSPRFNPIFLIMTKHLFSFVAAFVIGAVAALAVRSAWFNPHAGHSEHPAPADYAPMVHNAAAPSADPHAGHRENATPAPTETPTKEPALAPAPPADPHAGHGATKTSATVNSVCAICGMDVDTSIKPAVYQGKLVGFGCRMCPPKFARDPERYGPAALANKVVEN
jgi:hypothetical protein